MIALACASTYRGNLDSIVAVTQPEAVFQEPMTRFVRATGYKPKSRYLDLQAFCSHTVGHVWATEQGERA